MGGGRARSSPGVFLMGGGLVDGCRCVIAGCSGVGRALTRIEPEQRRVQQPVRFGPVARPLPIRAGSSSFMGSSEVVGC